LLVDGGYALSAAGIERLAPLLRDSVPLPPGKRCIDWTERHPHIGGALGSTLLRALVERGWLERAEGSRVLEVTRAGARGLRSTLGLDITRGGSVQSLREAPLAQTG
jgi:hypothetical protein